MKNIMGKSTVEEHFDTEFGIWDLNKFLGTISLFEDPEFDFQEKYVIISNNINPKTDVETSHELGIANIKARYKFLTTTNVEVSHSNDKFEVRIPLLNIEA